MAFRKVKDLAVVTGSYTDAQGVQKNRYKNIGSALKGDDGSIMLLLDRSFNPAGVPFRDGTDQIIVSMFDLRDNTQQANGATAAQPARGPAPQGASPEDDDIPFIVNLCYYEESTKLARRLRRTGR